MIDTPPNEALDACLYAIDLKVAEVRALLIELKALGTGSLPTDMPQMMIDAYIRDIEATLNEAILAQDILLARQPPGLA